MTTFTTHRAYCLLASLMLLSLGGCSTGQVGPIVDETPRVNRIARQQLPNPPVYNKLRWVHLPYTLPLAQTKVAKDRDRLSPIFHLELLDNSLKEASLALASTARYSSYCSELIAEDTITLNALGTIDELAAQISTIAGIEVVIDHEHREVRFLPMDAQQNATESSQEKQGGAA